MFVGEALAFILTDYLLPRWSGRCAGRRSRGSGRNSAWRTTGRGSRPTRSGRAPRSFSGLLHPLLELGLNIRRHTTSRLLLRFPHATARNQKTGRDYEQSTEADPDSDLRAIVYVHGGQCDRGCVVRFFPYGIVFT